jgi:hypothetical protein
MRNRAPDFSRGRFGRHGKSVIVVPYVYFGYPNGYADGGYAVENGGVSRTNSHASYTVEGHLDRTREPHSRVYEVGPGAENPESGEAEQTENETAENETAAEPVEYLIALKGGLVYVSREHWLLGDTVHFVTLQGDHYVVSLDELDMDLSAKLNRERGLKLVLEVREHGPGAPAAP